MSPLILLTTRKCKFLIVTIVRPKSFKKLFIQSTKNLCAIYWRGYDEYTQIEMVTQLIMLPAGLPSKR